MGRVFENVPLSSILNIDETLRNFQIILVVISCELKINAV